MTQQLLKADNITCVRGDKLLFQNLSFGLQSGEILQITGENGSGKSSLLRILTGLLRPQQGEISWKGCLINKILPNYYQDLFYLGHNRGIKLHLTVIENLQFDCRYPQPTEQALQSTIATFKLPKQQNQLCQQLSQGQRLRVALAKLLLSPAKLWVLDELMSALDCEGVSIIKSLFNNKVKSGGGIVFSSHHAIEKSQMSFRRLHL